MKSLSWSRGAREEKGEIGVLSWAIDGGVRGGDRLDSSGWRGEGRGHQRDGKGRWGVSGRHVEATRSRRWRGEAAQSGGGVALSAVRSRETERGRRQGPKHKFPKFQGPKCKTRITFKLKLK